MADNLAERLKRGGLSRWEMEASPVGDDESPTHITAEAFRQDLARSPFAPFAPGAPGGAGEVRGTGPGESRDTRNNPFDWRKPGDWALGFLGAPAMLAYGLGRDAGTGVDEMRKAFDGEGGNPLHAGGAAANLVMKTTPFLAAPKGALRSGSMRDMPEAWGKDYQRKLDDNGFYSVLEESIGRAEMKKGNAAKWQAAFKKAGVKDQERYWTGIDDWLQEQGNREITREELFKEARNRRTKVKRFEANEDGYDAESARESEIESRAQEYSDHRNYQIKPVPPPFASLRKRLESYQILPDPENPGKFKVSAYGPGERGPAVAEGLGSIMDAKRERRDYVRQELQDSTPDEYGAYDESQLHKSGVPRRSQEPFATGSNEHYVKEDLLGRAWDRARDDVEGMSDWELLNGDNGRERTSGYLSNRPEGGSSYVESLYGVQRDPTLTRRGFEGWNSSDDIHPDSWMANSPFAATGWNLTEGFKDNLTGTPGTVIHEMQSRGGQAGSKHGFKGGTSPEELAKLEAEAKAAEAERKRVQSLYIDPGANGIAFRLKTENGFLGGDEGISRFHGRASSAYTDMLTAEKDAQRSLNELNVMRRNMEFENAPVEWHNKTPEQKRAATRLAQLEEQAAGAQRGYEKLKKHFDEQYAPNLERIDFGQVGSSAPEGMRGAIENWQRWREQRENARLRAAEADNRWRTANSGIEPQPFIQSTSDFTNALLKPEIWNAAKSGDKWLGWTGPERIGERWGSHLEDYYQRTIPDTAINLYAQHDPVFKRKLDEINAHNKAERKAAQAEGREPKLRDAKEELLATVYPGEGPPPPMGMYRERSGAHGQGEFSDWLARTGDADTARAFSPFIGTDSDRLNIFGRLHSGQYTTSTPISGVQMVAPVGTSGQGRHGLRTDPGARVMWQLMGGTGRQHPVSGAPAFRSQAAAENAMRTINEQIERQKANGIDKDRVTENYGGEPFRALRFSPEAVESIKKNGFPLYMRGAGLSVYPFGYYFPEDDMAEKLKRGE